jgi:hypothetical protein
MNAHPRPSKANRTAFTIYSPSLILLAVRMRADDPSRVGNCARSGCWFRGLSAYRPVGIRREMMDVILPQGNRMVRASIADVDSLIRNTIDDPVIVRRM